MSMENPTDTTPCCDEVLTLHNILSTGMSVIHICGDEAPLPDEQDVEVLLQRTVLACDSAVDDKTYNAVLLSRAWFNERNCYRYFGVLGGRHPLGKPGLALHIANEYAVEPELIDVPTWSEETPIPSFTLFTFETRKKIPTIKLCEDDEDAEAQPYHLAGYQYRIPIDWDVAALPNIELFPINEELVRLYVGGVESEALEAIEYGGSVAAWVGQRPDTARLKTQYIVRGQYLGGCVPGSIVTTPKGLLLGVVEQALDDHSVLVRRMRPYLDTLEAIAKAAEFRVSDQIDSSNVNENNYQHACAGMVSH